MHTGNLAIVSMTMRLPTFMIKHLCKSSQVCPVYRENLLKLSNINVSRYDQIRHLLLF
jgi:hypothetical protein